MLELAAVVFCSFVSRRYCYIVASLSFNLCSTVATVSNYRTRTQKTVIFPFFLGYFLFSNDVLNQLKRKHNYKRTPDHQVFLMLIYNKVIKHPPPPPTMLL